MLRHPRNLFARLDPEYFETIDRYQPSGELLQIVRRYETDQWDIKTGGFWTYCRPKALQYRIQGWKIHISGMRTSAIEVLERIAPLLIAENVPFKFCSDLRMVRLSTSKNWPRTGAGKFITIYPENEDRFLLLVQKCYEATNGLNGPYILSDRSYKDSKVVFYRYGEHRGLGIVNSLGQHTPFILSPQGQRVSDERVAYFRLPDWMKDPFTKSTLSVRSDRPVVLKERYRVTGAIRYSARGGIYLAEDLHSGATVVIREARPMLDDPVHPHCPFKLLEKGARILRKLDGTGLAPAFVDFFQEWEHLFSVEEHLEAESLWGYAMNFTADRSISSRELFQNIERTTRQLIRGLEIVHENAIIIRDMTKTNVMFTFKGELKFVDFEFACELDRNDPPLAGGTEGYTSPEQRRNQIPTVHEDYYALGGLILDMIAFTASGLYLHREGILAGLRQQLADLGLPNVLHQIVAGLTEADPVQRWKPSQVAQALNDVSTISITGQAFESSKGNTPPSRPDPTEKLRADIQETIHGITTYIIQKPDFSRDDRLWPCSPDVFQTNPVSVEFGAVGIAYYLLRVNGSVPARIVDWIIDHTSPQTCPPGLYTGIAGVSLFLLDVGEIQKAKQLLESSYSLERIREVPGLYEGAAGWGLANLHFWHSTKEESYLQRALEVGKYLKEIANYDSQGAYWPSGGQIPLGLAFGASGVATFLMYLCAEVPNPEFISVAKAAVDFEIANATWVSEGPLWFPHKDATPDTPKSPHMRHGTAGVGTAAIRLYMTVREPRYRKFAEACASTVSCRFTNKLWQDYGPAGYSEFLIDMYRFLGDANYLNNAFYVCEGILPYAMYRPEGIAFPGAELLRVSCDFAFGSAGIGLVLHRVLNPQIGRLFLPEETLVEVANGYKYKPEPATRPQ